MKLHIRQSYINLWDVWTELEPGDHPEGLIACNLAAIINDPLCMEPSFDMISTLPVMALPMIVDSYLLLLRDEYATEDNSTGVESFYERSLN